MPLIVVSDESGDIGVSYKKGGTKNYIITIICFQNHDDINRFVDNARRISKQCLGTPLRKWVDLKGDFKNNPSKIKMFIEKLLNSDDFPILLGFYLLNKKELESSDKNADKLIIKIYADQGYELCFKRIFPFLKRYHFITKQYKNGILPSIEWYVDINDKEFISNNRKNIKRLASKENINLHGPYFLQKTDHTKKELVTAIKIIDILGGIASRAFNYYTENCHICSERDCNNAKSCTNKYMPVWKDILKYSMDRELRYKSITFWEWQSIIYSPVINRSDHSRFLSRDKFIDD